MARKEMLTLRIWLPGLYGWHLIFIDGVPVGCLSDEGLTLVEQILSVPTESDTGQDINRSKLLRDIGLSVEDVVNFTKIDPSISTILSDSVASNFIPTFYRYFADVFHEGSPFIDSDEDFLPIISRYFPVK